MNAALIRCSSLLGSLAVHAAVVLFVSEPGSVPRFPRPPAIVQLSVAARPSEPPEPERKTPEPEPPPPKEPPKALKPKPMPPPATDVPEPVPEPIAEELTPPSVEPPAELSGNTLVNPSGDGWAAPAGNGEARDGLIRSVAAPARARRAPAVGNTVAKPSSRSAEPPEAVPLAQLSRRPEPPSLTQALERNYPKEARSLGKSGAAKVRARIEANGAIRWTKLTFETSKGFGDACRRTLLDSRWSIPLDQQGKPAATWITYQCKFRVDG